MKHESLSPIDEPQQSSGEQTVEESIVDVPTRVGKEGISAGGLNYIIGGSIAVVAMTSRTIPTKDPLPKNI